MGKRQEAALETRQKIVDATATLLQEKKADAINIEDITQQAGVAKGTFYTHFKRKEDVISVIAMQCYAVMWDETMRRGGSAYEKLALYLNNSARIIEKNTLQIAQNWVKSVAAPLAGELCGVEKYNFDRRNIASILEGGVSRGELLPDTPCERLTDGIIDGYYGAVFVWCLTAGERALAAAIEQFCCGFVRPLLAQHQTET